MSGDDDQGPRGGINDFSSVASLVSDCTNAQNWASCMATATQSTTSSISSASSVTSTASLTTITTTNSNGDAVTSTYALAAATSAATSATASPESIEKSSGMSTGIKAAIGVGAVVGVIAIAALVFFCLRRRRRNEAAGTVNEKPRAKWIKHLRNFTFDNEMLLSARGSVRTGHSARSVIGSVRSSNNNIGDARLYHNINTHVDDLSPNPAQTNQVPVLITTDVDGQGTLDRSLSIRTDATPPPPYQAAVAAANGDEDSPVSPTSTYRNPFSDSRSNSPIRERPSTDENPFSDNYARRS